VKDSESLINTFKLVPEYLRSQIQDHVNDYSNWGIQLGRRFRALKLWFVIRSFGVDGLREKIRHNIALAGELKSWIEVHHSFELMAPVEFGLVCFRFHPEGINDNDILNRMNEQLLLSVNATGKVYITHTKLDGRYTLRIVTSQTQIERHHILQVWDLLQKTAVSIHKN
jgi:aromatic-L-amino-acid decarboxylase